MKKIYDGAIKDLMKLMVPDHAGPAGPPAPHGVQIHIHGATAPVSPDGPEAEPMGESTDPTADDLGLPPLGQDAGKHKAEMAAMHAKKRGM